MKNDHFFKPNPLIFLDLPGAVLDPPLAAPRWEIPLGLGQVGQLGAATWHGGKRIAGKA